VAPASTLDFSHSAKVVHRAVLPWIVRLRYGMIVGEVVLLLLVSVALHVQVPFFLPALAVVLQLCTNYWLGRNRDKLSENAESTVGPLLLLDAVSLTLILAMTGGATNPFSLLYLVHITFSAVILHRAWTWALGVVSAISFGLLFWISKPVPAFQTHAATEAVSLHLLGMWVAFTTAALLISYFIGKVSQEAREKEQELLVMQNQLARNERLASLVTLAAGAAHEIATPLATIAVSAREIERGAGLLSDRGLEEDARLIRSEVERCRLILERMGAQGGDPIGEAPSAVDLQELLRRTKERFPNHQARIDVEVLASSSAACIIPARAAVEALGALVKNALDASPDGERVVLNAQLTHDGLRFVIRDHGTGMTQEVIERVAEPFFTTKPPGQGMGLGAFLAHLFAQRLGGSLSFESVQGAGCTAILQLPIIHHVER
jgi:two-component system sensor histidine kinase RegB